MSDNNSPIYQFVSVNPKRRLIAKAAEESGQKLQEHKRKENELQNHDQKIGATMDVMRLSFYFNPCNPKSPEDPKKSPEDPEKSPDNGKLVENEFKKIKTISSFESIHKQFNETSKVQTPKNYSELKYKVPKYKIQKIQNI